MAKPLQGVVGYREIADLLGVGVASVRQYGYRDPRFPKPVTPEGSRSPMFLESEVRKWNEERTEARRKKSGRPNSSEKRMELSREENERLRELITNKVALNRAALAEKLGISLAALGFRLQGKTRWARSELTVLARLMGLRVVELLDALSDSEAL